MEAPPSPPPPPPPPSPPSPPSYDYSEEPESSPPRHPSPPWSPVSEARPLPQARAPVAGAVRPRNPVGADAGPPARRRRLGDVDDENEVEEEEEVSGEEVSVDKRVEQYVRQQVEAQWRLGRIKDVTTRELRNGVKATFGKEICKRLKEQVQLWGVGEVARLKNAPPPGDVDDDDVDEESSSDDDDVGLFAEAEAVEARRPRFENVARVIAEERDKRIAEQVEHDERLRNRKQNLPGLYVWLRRQKYGPNHDRKWVQAAKAPDFTHCFLDGPLSGLSTLHVPDEEEMKGYDASLLQPFTEAHMTQQQSSIAWDDECRDAPLKEFYREMARSVQSSRDTLYFDERCMDPGGGRVAPLFFDLDVTVPQEWNLQAEHVRQALAAMNDILYRDVYAGMDEWRYEMIVCTNTARFKARGAGEHVRYLGVHVYWPHIYACERQRACVRRYIIQMLNTSPNYRAYCNHLCTEGVDGATLTIPLAEGWRDVVDFACVKGNLRGPATDKLGYCPCKPGGGVPDAEDVECTHAKAGTGAKARGRVHEPGKRYSLAYVIGHNGERLRNLERFYGGSLFRLLYACSLRRRPVDRRVTPLTCDENAYEAEFEGEGQMEVEGKFERVSKTVRVPSMQVALAQILGDAELLFRESVGDVDEDSVKYNKVSKTWALDFINGRCLNKWKPHHGNKVYMLVTRLGYHVRCTCKCRVVRLFGYCSEFEVHVPFTARNLYISRKTIYPDMPLTIMRARRGGGEADSRYEPDDTKDELENALCEHNHKKRMPWVRLALQTRTDDPSRNTDSTMHAIRSFSQTLKLRFGIGAENDV